jgi:hypothetical protein
MALAIRHVPKGVDRGFGQRNMAAGLHWSDFVTELSASIH